MYLLPLNLRHIARRAFQRSAPVLFLSSAVLLGSQPALAQIRAVERDGRIVYVNDDEDGPVTPVKPSRRAVHASSTSKLAYWSVTEKRWKPVNPPSPNAMRAARKAAAEVAEFVESQPQVAAGSRRRSDNRAPEFQSGARAKTSAPQLSNPNYRELARGRVVTSGEIDKVIAEAAERHGVDPNLVRAIIKVESNFNPRAVSRAGAMGLMQLMPTTARNLKVGNVFDPAQNVDAGVRHLKGLLENYKGDVPLTLAAYNAGPGAVKKYGNRIPPYAETRNYVTRITGLYGSGALRSGILAVYAPVRVSRDDRGVLTITNTD